MITAICPTTASRNRFIPRMLHCFTQQTHADRELLVVSEDMIDLPEHPLVRFVSCPAGLSLGEKRNYCCDHARGELIVTWDSDDWYGPDYLSDLYLLMKKSRKLVGGYDSIFFLTEDGSQGWKYTVRVPGIMCGNTLAFTHAYWKHHPYPAISLGEDSAVIHRALAENQTITMPGNMMCVSLEHADNTWKRDHVGPYWETLDPAQVAQLSKLVFT